MKSFIYNYIRSMRLYYCFVTGTTVLAGILYGYALSEAEKGVLVRFGWRDVVLLFVGFLAWGVNQIFSDYLDRKEDAINAPHRPMVTGALKPFPAMILSTALMILMSAASALVSYWTLPVLAVGGLLNCAYSWMKRVPVINCLVYSMAISCCALYGCVGITRSLPDAFFIAMIALIMIPIHCLMCHNSYYKDVEGDRAAGVRTLQTCFHERFSLYVAAIIYILYVVILANMEIPVREGWLNEAHPRIILKLLGVFITLALICEHVFRIVKRQYHKATSLNCQLCVAMVYASLLELSWWLLVAEIISLSMIKIIFLWYKDEKE